MSTKLKLKVRVFAKYVRSKENVWSDRLSRLKIQDFLNSEIQWDNEPTEIPSDIWPIDKIWLN